jgi:ParB-like chromosome segregation protein Spo0J
VTRVLNEKIEQVALSRLSEHPENPRRGDVGVIEESLDEHGFYGVIVAQRSTGHILVGNHRYKAAQAKGMTKLPVAWVDVDDDEARRILLVDNRASDVAGYDAKALSGMLQELKDSARGFVGTGYDHDALRELLEKVKREEADFQPTEEPPPRLDEKTPVTCPECGHAFTP